ncbi:hypothetical protein DIS18_05370 [Algibacter marinivivus]|uniref:Type IV leader peptidase family protein n=1 Tax=Algibacter marinivivus TaxID=2100723 RepID=A0A2U2X869_9FLAO|nr:hypothetical protein [Algibacter marinivivus]PWH83978.1 hypothetical protein DIS18_05370 [Algibacter marinivivus]
MVFLQDIKERKVYWFLFPVIGICSGMLMYLNTFSQLFYTTVAINLIFVGLLIGVVFLYSRIKLKTSVSNTFGLGDGLLFLALAFSFFSVSFLILFVFGLLFSLVLHLFIKQRTKQETVPLAGYLSLFFAIAYISHWFGILKSVYTI